MQELLNSIKETSSSNKETLAKITSLKPRKIQINYSKDEKFKLSNFFCTFLEEINLELINFTFGLQEIPNIFEAHNFKIQKTEGIIFVTCFSILDLSKLNDILSDSAKKFEDLKELEKIKANLLQINHYLTAYQIPSSVIEQKVETINKLLNELNINNNIKFFSTSSENHDEVIAKIENTFDVLNDRYEVSSSNPNLIYNHNNSEISRNESNGGSGAGFVGRGTIFCSPGEKMLWEIKINKLTQTASWDLGVGVCSISHVNNCFRSQKESDCLSVWRNGELWNAFNLYKKIIKDFSKDDVIMIELDMKEKKLEFYINGKAVGGWRGDQILVEKYRLFVELRQPSAVEIISCKKYY